MGSSCLSFLMFCCLSGFFIFIILGIFTYTNNAFLFMMNSKKDEDGEYIIFDENYKKKAYLQYFIAALFDSLFALLIYYVKIKNRKINQKW